MEGSVLSQNIYCFDKCMVLDCKYLYIRTLFKMCVPVSMLYKEQTNNNSRSDVLTVKFSPHLQIFLYSETTSDN